MAISIILLFLPLIFFSSFSSSTIDRLSGSSSLSVEHADDVLTSPNGVFSAGFFPVGDNAYCFAIWFSEPYSEGNRTIVWMANRDQPVNGRKSELSLRKSGNAIITDAGRLTVWSTDTVSESPVFLYLHENGNLILQNSEGGVLWQSFDSPTDTLLPQQLLTKDMQLVSSRSQGNYSSGFYKLYFDDDNVLRLLYGGPEISVYWPDPELMSWEASRSTYNSSRIAFLDSLGYFSSSDNFTFMSADYGERVQRLLKLDFDGNVHAFQDSRSGIVRTGHWVVYKNSISLVPEMRQMCDCKGFQFKFIKHNYRSNIPYCYPKTQLLNGQRSPNFQGDMYLKVPKTLPIQEIGLDCSSTVVKQLNRTYTKHQENASLKTHRNSSVGTQNYNRITTGFRKFTLSELKKATQGFSKEIGRGSGGVVYKGMLSDHRIAAVKRLNDAYQGEAEFQAEVSTIGKLNHMNLTEMWGYCAEGKHRLLVYNSWIEMIIDPKLEGKYDKGRMEILLEVALKCVAEDRDARPTMSQVVEMILHQENDSELV
ncbi:receptor protein kinase ZmPK1 [Populus alba x Populus x berolinensis]|nr:receptor protein kinase ZmPK1 [Populus alba x Populus x berolinensis]